MSSRPETADGRIRRVAFVFGTRPEAIKLCPLILALRDHPWLRPHVCVTGQHRQMLDQVLDVFGVRPDVDLALMQPDQTLASLTSRAIGAIDGYLAEHRPDLVVVQGDTTSVFCAALAAFYRRVPVAHVEAGLRTGNKASPFPEEINRVLATHLADLHFAPTAVSRANLVREGVDGARIHVTGNTVIDALQIAVEKVRRDAPPIPGLAPEIMGERRNRPLVLVTGHRRENFGGGFENICHALADLAGAFGDTEFVYPVHMNPNVRKPVFGLLSGRRNIHLIEPLGYLPFVAMMDRARLILTDSGGVQEEAPSLGRPVLVMRDTTERPEAVEAGVVKLVGTDRRAIVDSVARLLTDEADYRRMATAINPYGDGRACGRIIAAIEVALN